MSVTVTATAPGKVMLSGEYAVLDGAPAIGMAVNRRASASVTRLAGDTSTAIAPGFSSTTARFRIDHGRVEWLHGKTDFALLDAVLKAAGSISEAVSIELLTQDFVDAGSSAKLGIGSSAALTVALTAAMHGVVDSDAIAHDAHRILQGGVGSGADIAFSYCGGVVEYRASNRQVERLQWPQGLAFRLLWSGMSTNTAKQIEKYQASRAAVQAGALQIAAEQAAAAWRSSDAQEVLSGILDYGRVLRRFDTKAQLGIFSPGHAALTDAASAAGLVYKPCGAGGGDTGILLGLDLAQLDYFVEQNAAVAIECELDPAGVRIESP